MSRPELQDDEDGERILPPFHTEADLEYTPRELKHAEGAPVDYQLHEFPPGFWSTEGHPRYRKGFRYETCVANTSLPSLLYSQCEYPPFKAGINQLDRSLFLGQNDDGIICTDKGFRSARANVCIRGGGRWYYETKIVKANEPDSDAHVRVGLARRESSVEAPVGADIYSYGVQDSQGSAVYAARLTPFMEPFTSGDVVGFEVCIPRPGLPSQAKRRRYPIKFKEALYFETIDYKPPKDAKEALLPKNYKAPQGSDLIPGSYVKVYKNGKFQGHLVEQLREFLPPHSSYDPAYKTRNTDDGLLGYFPMISVFKGGMAKFNLGPNFEYPMPEGARSLHERYDEQIADDMVLDILDEIQYEEIDARNPQANRQSALENQTTPIPEGRAEVSSRNEINPIEVKVPDVIEIKPTSDIEITPTDDIKIEPTTEIKPTDNTPVALTDNEIKPTSEVKIDASNDIGIKPTGEAKNDASNEIDFKSDTSGNPSSLPQERFDSEPPHKSARVET